MKLLRRIYEPMIGRGDHDHPNWLDVVIGIWATAGVVLMIHMR